MCGSLGLTQTDQGSDRGDCPKWKAINISKTPPTYKPEIVLKKSIMISLRLSFPPEVCGNGIAHANEQILRKSVVHPILGGLFCYRRHDSEDYHGSN
jgi:hypothetical protein